MNMQKNRLQTVYRLSIFTALTILFIAVVAIIVAPGKPWATFFDNLHWTVSYIAAVALAWVGIKTGNAENSASRRWFFYGLVSITIGQILWDIQVLIGNNPFPAPSDAFFLMFGVCFLIGLFQTMRQHLEAKDMKIALLDAGLLSISLLGLTLVLYLPISESISNFKIVILIAYPVILFTAGCLGMLSVIHVRGRPEWHWIACIVTLFIEGGIWMHWYRLTLLKQTEDLTFFNLSFSVAALVLGLTAMNWQIVPSTRRSYINWCDRVLRVLPLIAVVISAVTMLIVWDLDFLPEVKIVILASGITVLILAFFRQNLQVSAHEKLLEVEKSAAESRNFLNLVLESIPIRIFWKDADSRYLGSNRSFAEDAGFDEPAQLIGKDDYQMRWKQHAKEYQRADQDVMLSGLSLLNYEKLFAYENNQQRWIRSSKVPLKNVDEEIIGVIGIYDDITELKQTTFRENLRTKILEMLTEEASLSDTLMVLVLGVEEQEPDARCSVLLLDNDGKHLAIGAAPNLPNDYNQAITLAEIGIGVGSCGTAAFTGERVIVENVHEHPYWQPYLALAEQASIASCWSEPIKNGHGKVLGTFAIHHQRPHAPSPADIQFIEQMGKLAEIVIERCRSNEELKLAFMVYQTSSEGMMVVDGESRIIAINPAFTDMMGYMLDELADKDAQFLQSDRHEAKGTEGMAEQLATAGKWQGEIWNRRRNGEIFPAWLTINTIYDNGGAVHRRVFLYADISEKKKNEEAIWHQVNFDQLSGLPNRRMFHERLEQAIKKSKRDNSKLALMFLDLDRFKEVNDTLGHDIGDLLLEEAANRLVSCIRETDTVARFGGDEFTILLPDIADLGNIGRVAHTILEAMVKPYQLGIEKAYVSTSIGISLYPDDATDAASLLKNADQAMYAAKHQGRNRFNYFTPAMQIAAQHRMRIANDLREALAEQQFRVHYQPIIELATGDIYKAEALIRWQHPHYGLISPFEFIPIAEETGMIVEIGDWVFHQAVDQVAQWRALHHRDFQISVNKSPVQFRNSVSNDIAWYEHLNALELPGQAIAIEITESLLLEENSIITNCLQESLNFGMQVSLDDFGTGYSSMSYLKKFDIDYLKIDKSFVSTLSAGNCDLALCEAMIVMAHKLGIKVIAEGIETFEQLNLLIQAGCDFGQGYYWSRPLPAEEFDAFIRKGKGRSGAKDG